MKKYKHSFIISRFQPFHNGHKSIIDKMLDESQNITILLGSAQESRTKKNPLTVQERKKLLENIYGQPENIKILAINDIDCDRDEWYNFVMKFLKEKVPEFGFPDAYYCGDMENGGYYDKGEFIIEIVKREKQVGYKNISASQIREMIKNKDNNWKNYIPNEIIKLTEELFKNIKY